MAGVLSVVLSAAFLSAVATPAAAAESGSIAGVVTVEGGAPAISGWVDVYDVSEAYVGSDYVGYDGLFSIVGLAVGTYYVHFADFEYGADEWYNNASDFASATPVDVASGATTTIAVELAAPGTIAGTVTVEGGAPAIDGYATVYNSAGDVVGGDYLDPDGTYSVTGLVADTYFVQFSDFDNGFGEWYDNAADFGSATPVVVVGGATTTVDAELAAAGAIAGTVTVEGGPLTGDGYLYIYNSTGDSVRGMWVASDGIYSATGLAPGTYYLYLSDFDSGVDEWYDGASDFGSATPVVVVGAATTTLDVDLEAAGTIAGTVTVEGGALAVYGGVYLYDASDQYVGSAYVGSDGIYSFDGLASGTYYLSFASFRNGLNEWYDNASDFGSATPVVVVGGATTTVDGELAPAGVIAGTVTVEGGAPATGGSVYIYDSSGSFLNNTYTDSEGTYSIGSLPGGTYYLRLVSFDNGAPEWYDGASTFGSATPVTVVGGATTTVDVELAAAGTIAGAVTVEGGAAATGGYVYVYDSTGNDVAGEWVYSDGTYSIDGLATGTYYLHLISFDNGVPEWYDGASSFDSATPVTVVGGATTTVDVELAAAGTIAGTVTVEGGAPATDGYVGVYDSSGYSIGGDWTDSDGIYSVAGLAAGTYYLYLSDFESGVGGWYDTASSFDSATPVVVVGGATTTVDPVLRTPGAIEGTVTVEGGAPAIDGWVGLYDASGDDVESYWVGSDGTYSFTGLAAGTYYLQFYSFDNAAWEWYDGASDFDSATPVTVVGGATTMLDVELAAVGAIEGTVTVEGGALAIDGYVTVYDSSGDYAGGDDVGSDGTYSVDGLPSGTYYLRLHGFDDGASEWYDKAADFDSATPVVVVGGATTTIDVELAAAGVIAGTVTVEGGAPATDGYVDVYNSSGDNVAGEWVDSDGTYSVGGLGAGTYYVHFYEFENGAPEWYDNQTSLATATPVSVTGGETTTINAELAEPSSISGTVTLPAGAYMNGYVAAIDAEGDWVGWTDASSDDGEYTISGLAAGTYIVAFQWFSGAANEYYDNATSESAATPVVVGLGEDVTGIDATLEAEAVITGELVVPDSFSSGYACVGVYGAADDDNPINEACGEVGEPFEIDSLPAGSFYVRMIDTDDPYSRDDDDWSTFAGADGWYDNAANVGSATLVTLAVGQTLPLTFTWGSTSVPAVASVSPGFGPTAGGTSVTISGSGFSGATSVTFGGVAGTGLSVLSNTSLTVTTPAGTAVRAPVVVSSAAGDSLPAAAAFFAYTDMAVVAGIPEVIADVSGFTPNVVRCYQVTGHAGVPVGATGVVLNVTASLPNNVGHVRVYPDYMNNGASPAPLVSTVNFEVNRDVANSTTISLPTDGKVCAYGVGGTLARLILDVDGYTLPGSGITLITPEKLIDTRPQAWYHVGSIAGPVQPMTDYEVQVGGVGSVPSDAVAVIANITVVDTRSPGHLRMWASDQTMPNTSVVNYAPETKANSQIVALSADGKLTFRSFSWVPTTMSPVQVLIDVTGYIAAGSDFVATAPTKLVETRPAYGIVGPITGSLSPNTIYPIPVDTSVVPDGATAVILNVTAVQPTNFGHIRVYPDTNGLGTTPPPVMSNLNFIPGRDIPNMVIVQLPADRMIDLYTAYAGTGRTDLVVNIIGYIAGPPAG